MELRAKSSRKVDADTDDGCSASVSGYDHIRILLTLNRLSTTHNRSELYSPARRDVVWEMEGVGDRRRGKWFQSHLVPGFTLNHQCLSSINCINILTLLNPDPLSSLRSV